MVYTSNVHGEKQVHFDSQAAAIGNAESRAQKKANETGAECGYIVHALESGQAPQKVTAGSRKPNKSS